MVSTPEYKAGAQECTGFFRAFKLEESLCQRWPIFSVFGSGNSILHGREAEAVAKSARKSMLITSVMTMLWKKNAFFSLVYRKIVVLLHPHLRQEKRALRHTNAAGPVVQFG